MIVEPLKHPPQKIRDVERKYIIRVLAHFGWNQRLAAEALGYCRTHLSAKVNRYRKQGYPIPRNPRRRKKS